MAQKTNNSIIVGPVRLSYLNVFKTRENLNGEPEFSATVLIPKNRTEHCSDPQTLVKDVAQFIKGKLFEKFGKEPPNWKNPLKDGDKELDSEGNPRCPGYWFIRAKCKEDFPPVLVNGSGNVVHAGDGWKSGDWGKVKLAFYGFDHAGNKGVGVGLRAIQFLYTDEPLGGGSDAATVASEFGTVADAQNPVGSAPDDYDPFSDQ